MQLRNGKIINSSIQVNSGCNLNEPVASNVSQSTTGLSVSSEPAPAKYNLNFGPFIVDKSLDIVTRKNIFKSLTTEFLETFVGTQLCEKVEKANSFYLFMACNIDNLREFCSTKSIGHASWNNFVTTLAKKGKEFIQQIELKVKNSSVVVDPILVRQTLWTIHNAVVLLQSITGGETL